MASEAIFLYLVILVIWLFICFWVYSDAKKNSSHPPIMWAILVFMFGLIPLILYFIFGRNRR